MEKQIQFETLIYATLGGGLVIFTSFWGYLFTLIRRDLFDRSINFLYCFAGGLFLTNALTHLLPEALEQNHSAGIFCVIGVLSFYLLDHVNHRYHFFHTNSNHEVHSSDDVIFMTLTGDGLHNFVDGVMIGIAFLQSNEAGFATATAIFVHEIPQELGKWGIFLRQALPVRRILIFQFLTALTILPGICAVLFLGKALNFLVAPLLAMIAGNFIFIAIARLLPYIHIEHKIHLWRAGALIIGVICALLLAH